MKDLSTALQIYRAGKALWLRCSEADRGAKFLVVAAPECNQYYPAPEETRFFRENFQSKSSGDLSTLSITRIFTGALVGSSFRPSWSHSATSGAGTPRGDEA